MTGTLSFRWNSAPAQARIEQAAERTMHRVGDAAFDWWLVVVPVDTGQLRDSWFAVVYTVPGGVLLLFGATAPYAIYVELGTTLMEPRAPVRQTAAEVFPMIRPILRQELAA